MVVTDLTHGKVLQKDCLLVHHVMAWQPCVLRTREMAINLPYYVCTSRANMDGGNSITPHEMSFSGPMEATITLH